MGVLGAAVAGVPILAHPAHAASSDQTIAQAGLITLSDLPAGFTTASSSPSSSKSEPDFDAVARKIPACKALAALGAADKTKRSDEVKAKGDDLESGDTQVGSETSVFSGEGQARAAFSAISGPVIGRCLPTLMKTAMRMSFAKEAKDLPKSQRKLLKDIAVEVSQVPGPGTDAVTYRMVVTMGLLPGTPLNLDMVFARVGRAVGMYEFFQLGSVPTVEATVLPKVTARLAAAQA